MSSFEARRADQILTLRETRSEVTVSFAGDDDWVARFEKNGAFPALMWAQNMIECFNAREGMDRKTPARIDAAVEQ